MRPSLAISPQEQRAQGMPGARCTRSLAWETKKPHACRDLPIEVRCSRSRFANEICNWETPTPECPADVVRRIVAMSLARYDGTYSDARGRDVIAFLNDGETLRTTIRGVEFAGPDFDGLSPVGSSSDLERFTLNHGEMCACSFAFDIPVPVIIEESEVSGRLHVELELGAPVPSGGLE